jgi:1,2-diacylglycerol 3-beta-glucosyltransferase
MMWAVAITVAIYPAAVIALVLGMRRLRHSVPRADAACPSVTVVVTARNEIKALPRCVDALVAVDYPRDKMKFILVDDRSTDGTGEWLDALAARDSRVTVLHSTQLPDNGLEAKARGIAHGIARATGEWILITDADTRVPRTWARHLLGRVDGVCTVVGGVAMVAPSTWWGAFERAMWGFLQTINAGFTGFGAPIITVGPNMGIRRDAYLKVGGLEGATAFRMAEDLALFRLGQQAASGVRGWVQSYFDRETTVSMDEVPSLSQLMSQMRRFAGGTSEGGIWLQIGAPIAFVWGMLASAFFVAGWIWWPTVWLAFVVAKVASDLLLLTTFASRLGTPALVRDLARLTVLQIVAMAFVPPSLLFRRFRWRGEQYAVKYE